MKRQHLSFVVSLLALTVAPASAVLAADGTWEQVREEDGITVFQRPVEGTDLVEFRSRQVVAAPVMAVTAAVWDANRACEWMANCAQSFFLEKRPPLAGIFYERIRLGATLDDRDTVVLIEVDADVAKHTIILGFHNVEDARKPATDGVVRMPTLRGSFTLRDLGGDKTEVSYQLLTDPKTRGVPSFLVNRFARDVPFDTQVGLRKQVRKPVSKATLAEVDRAMAALVARSATPAPKQGRSAQR